MTGFSPRQTLLDLLLEARALVARPDNAYLYSSWPDASFALMELDVILAALVADGPLPIASISSVLLPTGPMQELAIDSGWGDEFVELAGRIDEALVAAADADEPDPTPDAGRLDGGEELIGRFVCSICHVVAGEFFLAGPPHARELRRVSFTGVLLQPVSDDLLERLRKAMTETNARRTHEIDPELTPFYCPPCDASFCGDHWHTWDTFDDAGFHDAVRGRCPLGHERMLED